MTDVVYEAECERCDIITTIKAIKATNWKDEYDGPCGYCGNMLRMKVVKVE